MAFPGAIRASSSSFMISYTPNWSAISPQGVLSDNALACVPIKAATLTLGIFLTLEDFLTK